MPVGRDTTSLQDVREVEFSAFDGSLTVLVGRGPLGGPIGEELRVSCGALQGVIKGSFVFFDGTAVREDLRALLARPDISGRVELVSSEHGEVRAWVVLERGRGVLSIEIGAAPSPNDRGGGLLTLTTDQSSLADALRTLNAIAHGP